MIEKELKYELATRAELERLAALLGRPGGVEKQENSYFDTASLALHRGGMLIRLRKLGPGRTILTVKAARRVEPGMITAEEEERSVTEEEARAVVSRPGEALRELGGPLMRKVLDAAGSEPILRVADLRTERRIFRVREGELALDVISFPAGPAFEVELETEEFDRGKDFLKKLFARADIASARGSETKTTRLFRQLRR